MIVLEILKVIVFGIVEGITEWLPISSTGHIILLQSIMPLNQPEDFFNVFKVVIQLGAILAIVVLFWDKLFPLSPSKTPAERKRTWILWTKIVIACIPAAVVGLPLDDFLDEHLSTPVVIGCMLIMYGIIFILMENYNGNRRFPIRKVHQIDYKTAVLIGLFQCLSLIPGTSRSGATIIGSMVLGCSRAAAAEFSFFLGIPVMFGASLLKIVKHGFDFTLFQWFTLIFGMLISFIVALLVVRGLMEYIRKHNFKIFGYYRIIFGIIVLLYFIIAG